ncbi:MAG: glycosyltransferase family 4 protein [Jatrophihabitans sp.]|uniref:glycosyltransferase family 4 protein n=1 Tax=Jatrophihabitans sp. TaxID=1932789 RepID=UPI003F804964
MRIGLIAPPWVTVPPVTYGGTEAVVADLATALRLRGHEVHLFTVGASRCPVVRHHLFARPAEPMGEGLREAAHVLAAYEVMADLGVDVVHDHTTLGALVGAHRLAASVPVVLTNHNLFDADMRRVLLPGAGRAQVVAVSRAHAATARPVPVDAVVPHGIDLQTYRPGTERSGGYLVFVGRMAEEKGVHLAVEVARRAGRPLRIIAKMRSEDERTYYARRIEPLLGPDDPRPEELPLPQRIAVLRGADALLDPIRWPEPFGLVMAESLACGVPVIGSPFGAAPEIVESGRTGFLCQDVDQMVSAVHRLPEIDRHVCRAAAVRRFDRDRMARDYEAVYARAIARRSGGRPGRAPQPVREAAG